MNDVRSFYDKVTPQRGVSKMLFMIERRNAMRTGNEIKEAFYHMSEGMVKRCFEKRRIKRADFTKEDMEAIKKMDAFLQRVSGVHGEEEDFTSYKKYFCIMVKMSMEYKGVTYERCYHRYFESGEAFGETGKIPCLAAKAIYLMNQCKHAEVFYCVNLLRARYKSEYGFFGVDRVKENCVNASSLYIDLDLPEELMELSDGELLEKFMEEFGELCACLHPELVRSGGGLHLYVPVVSLPMEDKDIRNRWMKAVSDLGVLLSSWGADCKCMDVVRVLRPVGVMNRKKKYGKGKEVRLLMESKGRMSLEEIESQLSFLLKGGSAAFFESLLSEMIWDGTDEKNELRYVFKNRICG